MSTTEFELYESLVETGRKLSQTVKNARITHDEFSAWDDDVAKWLNTYYPGSGAAAEWSALSASPLATGGGTREDTNTWAGFRISVQRRLKWLASYAPVNAKQSTSIALQSAVDEARTVLEQDEAHEAHNRFVNWVNSVSDLLRRTYPHTSIAAEWTSLPYSNLIKGGVWSRDRDDWPPFRDVVMGRIAWLGKLLAAESQSASQTQPATLKTLSNRVFIVHGHNDALKDATARYLTQLRLEPVILHEQPNKGRTIIEKFVDYADVGFAVVLMTADDQGGTKDCDRAANRPRARQNVILELGYFLGKLDRARVCAIYDSGVEIPTDYSGVIWIEHDSKGAWRLQLAKEIKAAGIKIDMNDAI